MATKKRKEMPLKEMLAKRIALWKKLVKDSPPMSFNDIYGASVYNGDSNLINGVFVPYGTVIVIKSQRSGNICGIGIFSNDGFIRMTPIYFSDKYYDAAKVGDVLDVYLYNETTGTMRLCLASWFNRHTNEFFNVFKMPKWYTNIELRDLTDIGTEDVKV